MGSQEVQHEANPERRFGGEDGDLGILGLIPMHARMHSSKDEKEFEDALGVASEIGSKGERTINMPTCVTQYGTLHMRLMPLGRDGPVNSVVREISISHAA